MPRSMKMPPPGYNVVKLDGGEWIILIVPRDPISGRVQTLGWVYDVRAKDRQTPCTFRRRQDAVREAENQSALAEVEVLRARVRELEQVAI